MSGSVGARPRVLIAAPDPRNPGGISGVIESWRGAGLAERVELTELPTSAMDGSLPVKIVQMSRAAAALLGILASRSRRPQVVHLHASTGGSLLRKLVLALICRLGRVPYIAHEHSGQLDEWIDGSSARRRAARSLYSHAALVIVLAERWRALVESLGARRVEVLANGISAAERRRLAAAERLRSLPGRGSGQARLVFYGRWSPKKGPDRLAAALRAIGRDDYELHLYGSGDRAWLEALFEGVPGRISIDGWLRSEEKVTALGTATALIAPSRAEGLPMALVEARAAGTPTIATDVGAVADALAGYRRALLIPSGDEDRLRAAIERVIEGEWPPPSEPAELPDRLRSEVAVERLLGFYRELADPR